MEHEASANGGETNQTKRQKTQIRNTSFSPFADFQVYKNLKMPERRHGGFASNNQHLFQRPFLHTEKTMCKFLIL